LPPASLSAASVSSNVWTSFTYLKEGWMEGGREGGREGMSEDDATIRITG